MEETVPQSLGMFPLSFVQFYALQSTWIQKVRMLGSFTFSETRPAKWPTPQREQEKLWNVTDVPLTCFLRSCSGICLRLCATHLRAMAIPNFSKARLLLIMNHGLVLWLFVKFFLEFFQDFCPCGLARGITVTNRIWLFRTTGASCLNGTLCWPDGESRLRRWSFSCYLYLFLSAPVKMDERTVNFSFTQPLLYFDCYFPGNRHSKC